ncbi:MAG: hypothetical protein JW807_00775 [Spirochaetes bacterium]|nr:hypothetical protein [Spirochaetota bacterium]
MKGPIVNAMNSLHRRLLIAQAFGKLKRKSKGPISLTSEYYFKGACAALIETCGFVPDGYISDVARLDLERKLISQMNEERLRRAREAGGQS